MLLLILYPLVYMYMYPRPATQTVKLLISQFVCTVYSTHHYTFSIGHFIKLRVLTY